MSATHVASADLMALRIELETIGGPRDRWRIEAHSIEALLDAFAPLFGVPVDAGHAPPTLFGVPVDCDPTRERDHLRLSFVPGLDRLYV